MKSVSLILLFAFASITQAIFSGVDVEPHSAPYIVNFRKSSQSSRADCSGVILKENAILTSWLCAFDKTYIIAGDHNLNINEQTEQNRTIIKTVSFNRDAPNSIATHDSNFAIVFLTEDLVFNDYVEPINLPKIDQCLRGKEIVAYGWGRINSTTHAETLKKATLPIVDRDLCAVHSELVLTSENICTGKSELEQALDVYDRGGPLIQYSHLGIPYLVGISFYSLQPPGPAGIGDGLNVGGNVASVRDFIDKTLKI